MDLEHVIVWYQVDTLSTVKRLYGRLNADLKSSDHYLLLIDNCKSNLLSIQLGLEFDINIFNGRKILSFEEVNNFGGNNDLMGLLFMAAACAYSLMILSFVLLYFLRISTRPGFYEIENTTW